MTRRTLHKILVTTGFLVVHALLKEREVREAREDHTHHTHHTHHTPGNLTIAVHAMVQHQAKARAGVLHHIPHTVLPHTTLEKARVEKEVHSTVNTIIMDGTGTDGNFDC